MATQLNTSLQSIESIVILDLDGNRLLSRFYGTALTKYPTGNSQSEFERSLFQRTRKQLSSEIVALRNTFALFRSHSDLVVYVTAVEGENELFIGNFLDSLLDVLNSGTLAGIGKDLLDKRSFLNAYDMVVLVLDEMLENGVIIDTDVQAVTDRVDAMRKTTLSATSSILESVSQEKSIAGAFSAAKEQLAKRFFGIRT